MVVSRFRHNHLFCKCNKCYTLCEHTAPFDAIVQILDGTAEVIIDKKPHLLTTGQSIIMPANVSHALTATERFKMLLIMIKG